MRRLTARQLEVAARIAEGDSNKQIAAALTIGAETVKAHLGTLRMLLRARNKAHIVALLFRAGELR